MQEDFQGTVVTNKGWQYAAQRPDAKNFVEQKWGWVSTTPGETHVLASAPHVNLTDVSAPMRCGAQTGLGFDPSE